jgi:hypothetical protein
MAALPVARGYGTQADGGEQLVGEWVGAGDAAATGPRQVVGSPPPGLFIPFAPLFL